MSDTTMDLLEQLRAFLLTYLPMGAGATLTTLLAAPLPSATVPSPTLTRTAQLYHEDPPDDAAGCYAALRLINRIEGGADGGIADSADLEVMVFTRGRTTAAKRRRELAADVLSQALQRYFAHDVSGGFLVATGRRSRDNVPRPVAPADADLGTIRLTVGVEVWPAYLTLTPGL